MRKLLLLILSLVFLLFSGMSMGIVHAEKTVEPVETIKKLVDFENKQEWKNISSLWVSNMELTLKEFLSNPDNKDNHLGLFNIKKASLVSFKQISNEYKELFPNMKENSLLYYVALDLKVYKEDIFHMDGINYFLMELILENNEWKISQIQNAPVDIIGNYGIGFNTEDEKQMSNLISKRYKGEVVNRQNKIIEVNKLSNEELIKRRGETPLTKEKIKEKIGLDDSISIQSTADHVEPLSIKVYMTLYSNRTAYNCSSNCVKYVNFEPYVKNVLPNEWGISWHANSLKTGALAVKMYGWYGVYYPLASSVGAHVYDDTRNQVYVYNSEVSTTSQAVIDSRGIGLHRKDNQALFLTEYIAGTSGSPGTKASGKISQYGSKYWAESGWYPYQILEYYYNDSTKVGGLGKKYEFFVY